MNELDLASLNDVRAWLGFNAATVEHDDALSRMITACSRTMQRLMGRTIAAIDYTHNQDGPGAAFMVLRNSPIVRIKSLVVDGRTIDPQYIAFDETTIYLSGSNRFTRDRNNVALCYTAGYDDIPEDLAQACIETVGLRWRERDRIGMTSKAIGGETTSFSLADFSDSANAVMGTYQRVSPV